MGCFSTLPLVQMPRRKYRQDPWSPTSTERNGSGSFSVCCFRLRRVCDHGNISGLGARAPMGRPFQGRDCPTHGLDRRITLSQVWNEAVRTADLSKTTLRPCSFNSAKAAQQPPRDSLGRDHSEKFWQFESAGHAHPSFERLGLVSDVRWAKGARLGARRQRLNGARCARSPFQRRSLRVHSLSGPGSFSRSSLPRSWALRKAQHGSGPAR